MPTQGELFKEAGPLRASIRSDSSELGLPPEDPSPAPVWLQRISLIILVLFCFYIGALLTVLPWSPRFWDGNGWLRAHRGLHDVLMQGWVRGLFSGLGLLDIWIGVSELLHYRDLRRTGVAADGSH